MRAVSIALSATLVLLSARRALFAGASLVPPVERQPECADEPRVALLVPAHNEAVRLGELLASIERLDWPRDRLRVTLVDDFSDDATWEMMKRWARRQDHVQIDRLHRRSGKREALNVALRLAGEEVDVVVVCDADLRLASDYVKRLVPAFQDSSVGAAAAFVTSADPDSSVVSRYCAVETWVHQLVTAAGKDRLGLNPATFAGSAYRRTALEMVGGFPGERAGDDVDAAAALTRAGWKTCFVAGARADHVLPEHARDYWRQHLRWGRNVFEAGRSNGTRVTSASRRQRLELALAAVGYGDRVAFGVALFLVTRGRMRPGVPALYAALRAFETVLAIARAGEARRIAKYIAAIPVVLPLDIAASAAGAAGLSAPEAAWSHSRRSETAHSVRLK